MSQDYEEQALEKIIGLRIELNALEKMVEGGTHIDSVYQQCLRTQKTLVLLNQLILEERLKKFS